MNDNLFTIRTVTSAGVLDKFLPDYQSLDLSPVFSAVGSVVIKYPENGVNFNLLGDDVEIAVMLNGVEVEELRCVIDTTEGDDATDASDGMVWTFTARTMLGRLDQAVVYPSLWPTTTPPNQAYVDTKAGALLIDLMNKAQARGSLPWLSWDFTATTDSNGAAWVDDIDMTFDAGTNYYDVIDNLHKNGFVEVQMNGRVLSAYKPDTLGSDKSVGANPLRFIRGRDMKDSPRKSSVREVQTTMLVAGKDAAYTERVSAGPIMSLWGRREGYYSANNAPAEILNIVGDRYLETKNEPKLEVTHGLFFEVPENPKPVLDFVVGDWALSDVGRGWERYRIKQWVASVDTSGSVTGSVTLNMLIDERIAQLNQRIDDIENGTTSTGSSEEKDDGIAPAVPTGQSATSDYYIQGGRAYAAVTFDWNDVTLNTNGSTMTDFGAYTARWRYASDASNLWRAQRQVTESIAYFDGVAPNAAIKLQVECHDKFGNSAGYTSLLDHTTAGDTTPPSKTSSPIVTSNVGTLRVLWDGKRYDGAAMEADTVGVEVHVGPNGTFTPDATTLKDFLGGTSAIATTITGLTYDTEYWVRLVAVDSSGNKGAASDETSTSHAVLKQIVMVEIGTGQVGLNNTTFSDVGNLIDDGNFENSQLRSIRTAAMASTHMAFDSSTSSVGTWSLRSDSYAGATSESLKLQGSLPVKPGERVFGAADYRFTSDVPGSSYLRLAVRWVNAAGNYIDNTGTVANVYYDLTNNWVTTADNLWHNRISNASQVAPTNAVNFEIWLVAESRTVGTIWIDAVEVRRQVDTLLVADLAVTTAKIGNLAVTNAKISDLSVGKLTTGTLGADVVVGARIKTADTGARVELSSSGLLAYNGSGTQTVNIAASDGSVSILGQLKSGTSGRRIEINPTATYLPEIRFYAASGSNYGFINGVSGGTGVYLGINGGQYSASGTNVQNRLYMAEGLITLEQNKVSDQSQYGGSLSLGLDDAYWSVKKSGDTDYPFVRLDQAGGYAQIGWESGTTATDTYAYFKSNGQFQVYGRGNGFESMSPNSWYRTSWNWFSGNATMSLGYGATMATSMDPGGTYHNDNSEWPAIKIAGGNSTGYTIKTEVSTYGAWSEWSVRSN